MEGTGGTSGQMGWPESRVLRSVRAEESGGRTPELETLIAALVDHHGIPQQYEPIIKTICYKIPGRKKAGLPYAASIGTYLEKSGYDELRSRDVVMVLEEALNNGIEWACHEDPDKDFSLTWSVYAEGEKDYLVAKFAYCGNGFDTSTIDIYTARDGRKGTKGSKRHGGHSIMSAMAEYLRYDEYGKAFTLILELEKPVPRIDTEVPDPDNSERGIEGEYTLGQKT